jgi:SAM-dependent methyltransferase
MNKLLKSLKKNQTIYNLLFPLKKFYRKIKNGKYITHPGLIGRISYMDTMFVGDINHYIAVANSAMENIDQALKASNKTFDSLKEVLDLPSGHGRVLRLLTTKVSAKNITACDVDADGINFCEKEFGCKKFLSTYDLSKIQFPTQYSLIWVGSLFTHLNKDSFTKLLKLLFNSLELNGVVVFTTHGNYSVETFESYWLMHPPAPISQEELKKELEKSNGFYFAPYPNTEDYGISISLNHYVISLVETLFQDKAKIVMYKERGWDNHQNVFAIQRIG